MKQLNLAKTYSNKNNIRNRRMLTLIKEIETHLKEID